MRIIDFYWADAWGEISSLGDGRTKRNIGCGDGDIIIIYGAIRKKILGGVQRSSRN
jgi:hypothetical protein